MKPYSEYTDEEIKKLEHHKDCTCGLWAMDVVPSNLLTAFWQSSSDACPLEASEAEEMELAFREFVEKYQFQIDF
jgi:hypothetical protein